MSCRGSQVGGRTLGEHHTVYLAETWEQRVGQAGKVTAGTGWRERLLLKTWRWDHVSTGCSLPLYPHSTGEGGITTCPSLPLPTGSGRTLSEAPGTTLSFVGPTLVLQLFTPATAMLRTATTKDGSRVAFWGKL